MTYVERFDMLDNLFPHDISLIIEDYRCEDSHKYAKSLMKAVHRDIKKIRSAKLYTAVSQVNRIRGIVINIATSSTHQYKGISYKHLDKFNKCLELLNCQPPVYGRYRNRTYIYRSMTRYGFKTTPMRQYVKWCRLCDRILSIHSYTVDCSHVVNNSCRNCHLAQRRKYYKYDKKPTGFNKIPKEIQDCIIFYLKYGLSISEIANKCKGLAPYYPMLKLKSLQRLNRLGQIPN